MRAVRRTPALAAAAAFAAALAAAAADDPLAVARSALRDGLWEVARRHAAPLAAATNEEARLVVLESRASEGDWKEVANLLASWKESSSAPFAYYRAVAAGDHAAAAKLLKDGKSPAGIAAARLFEAEALAKSGDRAGAEAIWRSVAEDPAAGPKALAAAASNLMDPALLRRAYAAAANVRDRRALALRLGTALLAAKETAEEGERLVRAAVRDSPDAEGAEDAFLAIADAALAAEEWKKAADCYSTAMEIWPAAAKRSAVHDGRGWAMLKLERRDEALAEFVRAAETAATPAAKAAALLKQGDVLAQTGRGAEAMEKYREALRGHPDAPFAERLKKRVAALESEAAGRKHYRNYRFGEARKAFAAAAADEPERAPRMEFFEALCLYGQGEDAEACAKAAALAAKCKDPAVRADAAMWLAKYTYNRRDWKRSAALFSECAGAAQDPERKCEALLWAARASLAAGDAGSAVALTTRLAETGPKSPLVPAALIVQGEALIEMARFEEAVLVLDRAAAAENAAPADRLRAATLRADALFATGSDNPARHAAALEAYREIQRGGAASPSAQIEISFKVARALEKLDRTAEAEDEYYTQVVFAYWEARRRGARLDDAATAAFSRAAFRLAEIYEARGRDEQAAAILRLVATSGVPAAAEASKRIERIARKGRFL